jgi:hypothetical protein
MLTTTTTKASFSRTGEFPALGAAITPGLCLATAAGTAERATTLLREAALWSLEIPLPRAAGARTVLRRVELPLRRGRIGPAAR